MSTLLGGFGKYQFLIQILPFCLQIPSKREVGEVKPDVDMEGSPELQLTLGPSVGI